MQAYQPLGDPRTREEWQLDSLRDAYAEGKLTDAELEQQVERVLRGQPLAHRDLPMFEPPVWRDLGKPIGRPSRGALHRLMRSLGL